MEKYTVEHIKDVVCASQESLKNAYLEEMEENVLNKTNVAEVIGNISWVDRDYMMGIIIQSLYVLLNENNDCIEE